MSIFEIQNTREDQVREVVKELVIKNNEALESIKNNFSAIFGFVWDNPKATPQEIFDAFGIYAKDFFVASAKTVAFIKALDPSYPGLDPLYEYTINEDGTVTVGNKLQ